MAFIIIYVTHENEEEARKIVDHLLQKKMIACANLFPIKSIYWWKEKIEDSEEFVSILKTKNENWEKVNSEIEKIHPYDVPCIIKPDVESNESYDSWINSESK